MRFVVSLIVLLIVYGPILDYGSIISVKWFERWERLVHLQILLGNALYMLF